MLDDDDGPERYGEDPDAPAVLPRKPKASLLKKMAGDVPTASVGSSLDSFITKANEGLLDLKENPPSRERELEAKVDELEKKLASAEARAKKAEAQRAVAAEPVMPLAPQSRGWGGIVVAFVLGCGAMFAVSTLLLKKESTPQTPPAVAQPTPEQEQPPAPTPAPQPQVQPETAQTPPSAVPTAQPEAQPEQVAKTPETATATAKVAAKKTPKHGSGTNTSTTTGTNTGTQTKPPDPAHSGSDELYNPF